jgi:hypothetical protein
MNIVAKIEADHLRFSVHTTPYATEQGLIFLEQGCLAQEQGILLAKTKIGAG